MYFIPLGLLLRGDTAIVAATQKDPADFAHLTWNGFLLDNMLPVTLGNMIGGAVMAGLVYWFVCLRGGMQESQNPTKERE
jgi:formate transporter